MTIADKLKQNPNDQFWNLKQQEEAARQHFEAQLDGLERARGLCQRMLALKGAAGYEDMLKSVGELEAHANEMLLSATEPHEMWKLQGRVSALREIRSLMVNTENRISAIDSQREILENQRSAIFRPDGKANTGATI